MLQDKEGHLYHLVAHCLLQSHWFIQWMFIEYFILEYLYFIFLFKAQFCCVYDSWLARPSVVVLFLDLVKFRLVCPCSSLCHSLRLVEMLASPNCLLLRTLLFLTKLLDMEFLLNSALTSLAAEFFVLTNCHAGLDRTNGPLRAGVGVAVAPGQNAKCSLLLIR